MPKYNELLNRRIKEHGEKFDSSDLSPQFTRYYENQWRIEVDSDGDIKRGRVGVTTGWKPSFILIFTKRSLGSYFTLSSADKILKIVSCHD